MLKFRVTPSSSSSSSAKSFPNILLPSLVSKCSFVASSFYRPPPFSSPPASSDSSSTSPSFPSSSASSAVGSGGMKFTPSSISTLDTFEDNQMPVFHSQALQYGNLPRMVDRQENQIVDSAAPRLLKPEDREERARRLRHYKPVALATRQRITADSPHRQYHRVTPEKGFGERVDDFLKKVHPDFSHDTLKRLVEGGHVYRYREGRKVYCRLTDRLQNGEFLVVPTKNFFSPPPASSGASESSFATAPPGGDVYESLRTGSGDLAQGFRQSEEQRKEIHLSYKVKQEALDWVLFKNPYVIVLNKPSGVPVTRTSDGTLNLSDMLPAWKFTMTNRPLICNYLDRETSGIVVLARTHETHRMLGKMFQKRVQPNSSWWGFCVGTPKAQSGRIKMHLETMNNNNNNNNNRKGGSNTGMIVARASPTPDSKVALAEYVVNASAAEYASFLSFYPLTSRPHQLRIMAAHALRCPVVGDARYGGEHAFPENLDALLGVRSAGFNEDDPSALDAVRKATKLHLHFRKIQLPYKKRSGEFECVSAPMPEHMKMTFQKLGWATNLDDPLIPG